MPVRVLSGSLLRPALNTSKQQGWSHFSYCKSWSLHDEIPSDEFHSLGPAQRWIATVAPARSKGCPQWHALVLSLGAFLGCGSHILSSKAWAGATFMDSNSATSRSPHSFSSRGAERRGGESNHPSQRQGDIKQSQDRLSWKRKGRIGNELLYAVSCLSNENSMAVGFYIQGIRMGGYYESLGGGFFGGSGALWKLVCFLSLPLFVYFLSLLFPFLYEQSIDLVIEKKTDLELSTALSKKRLCPHKSVVNLEVILCVAQHCPSPGTSSW